ncbi:hypothetical protein BJ170DRAFT_614360 [Xylariales sp. AK1849]|nr:hypothetical protein BJ170DRAFT_614360 [Xylariales sp. AK1849]
MESADDLAAGLHLFNMLPSSLQSRIPALLRRFESFESLRTFISPSTNDLSRLPSRHLKSTTAASSNSSSSSSSSTYLESPSSSSTPTTSHYSVPTSLHTLSDEDLDSSDLQIPVPHSSGTISHWRRQQTERSLPATMEDRQPLGANDRQIVQRKNRLPRDFNVSSYDTVDRRWSPSGIKWRYARQGAHLTTIASEEMDDADFERRSFIDGVAYLLRACPDNLTPLETDIFLRSAPWLAEQQRPPPGVALVHPTDRGRTFLHRSVQYTVACLIVLAHALWSFMLIIGRVSTHYEKQYHISDWILANGYGIANAVGRHSVVLSGRINAMGEGKVSQILGGVCAWTVDSLTGGIQDGYGDGMARVRRRPGRSSTDMDRLGCPGHDEP